MILYKYYPPSINTFKSLINAGIWCDNYANMNDPFECLAIVPRIYQKEQIEEFRSKAVKSGVNHYRLLAGLSDDKIIEFMNQFRQDFIKNSYFFGSLSETYDNILLWSHYAASHTGFVLAIDLDENNNHIQKVIYQDQLPSFDVDWFFSLQKDEDTSSQQIGYLLKDFAIKSKNWAYEKEWRACRRTRGYFRFHPDQVKAIYLGLNCHIDIEKVIIVLPIFPDNTPIYKMELSTNPLTMVAKDYELPND